LGDWDASLSGVRYGTLPAWDGTGRTRPMLVWNANIGKRITPALDLKFFVNNLFNALHPEDGSNIEFPYFYDTYSPVGREVALQMRYRFQ
jgi:iron complex outermembrane recepter protein